MKRLTAWVTVGGLLMTQAIAAAPVYADHETRDQVLGESGIDVLLVSLVLAAAVIALAAFAAGILWWERQDRESADQDEQ